MYDMQKISCPHCGKKDFRTYGTSSTCMYYPPRYVNGVNVNPDRNVHFAECECCACNKPFYIKWRCDEHKVFKTIDEARPTWEY